MDLTHKRILITRPRARTEEFAKALLEEGAQPVFFPVIEIAPLSDFAAFDYALYNLDRYDWLVLTSIHAVESFFNRLKVLGIKGLPKNLHVAAIGPKTAQWLSEHEVQPHFVPVEYSAEAILSGLNGNIAGKRFLLPQSNLAREFLPKELRSAGGSVDEVVAYHTTLVQPDASSLNILRAGVDVITFASPSSVKGFVHILDEYCLNRYNLPGDPLIACIGPVTAMALREAGFLVHVEAKEHTILGLITALKIA